MKITIPSDSAKNGGALYTLIDDLTNLNSAVVRGREGDNLIVDDNPASVKIVVDQTILLLILSEGGEIEEALFSLKMPTSFANTLVPVGVPYRDNVVGNARRFDEWFITGSEVWIDLTNGFFVFYTNPLGVVGGQNTYLKASEIELIRQLDTVNISILTLEEAQTEVNDVAKNYNKVIW